MMGSKGLKAVVILKPKAKMEFKDEKVFRARAEEIEALEEEIALVADVDSLDTENGMLTLMTLHNAKGLEFQAIYLAGMEEGLTPHQRVLDGGRRAEGEGQAQGLRPGWSQDGVAVAEDGQEEDVAERLTPVQGVVPS